MLDLVHGLTLTSPRRPDRNVTRILRSLFIRSQLRIMIVWVPGPAQYQVGTFLAVTVKTSLAIMMVLHACLSAQVFFDWGIINNSFLSDVQPSTQNRISGSASPDQQMIKCPIRSGRPHR